MPRRNSWSSGSAALSAFGFLLFTACPDSKTPPGGPEPRVASAIVVIAGDGQVANVGQPVSIAPRFRVLDDKGVPMSGSTVTFVANGNAALSQWSAESGASGEVTPGNWTLGITAGRYTLTAVLTQNPTVTASIAATATSPTPQLQIVTQPSSLVMTTTTLDRPPVVRAINANGVPVTVGDITATIDGSPGASITSGARVPLASDGSARFSALSIGVAAGTTPWLASNSTLVRIRFDAPGFSPVISDTIRLRCFELPIPLDRAFTHTGSIQPGDCVLGQNRGRDFTVDQPMPAQQGDDNAINLLFQQTMNFMASGIVISRPGSRADERFGRVVFGPQQRARVLLGPGRSFLSVLGDDVGSLLSQPYVFATQVQTDSVASPCTGDETFVPMQPAIVFSQRLGIDDCRLADRTYADRYGMLLAPGTTVTVSVEAIGAALPGLSGYLFANQTPSVNATPVSEITRGVPSGRSVTISMRNTDVITRFYSFAVSALDPSTVGRYRVHVSFNRP